MTDQEHKEWLMRYLEDMERFSRERLSASADLIAKFTALAASKGVNLSTDSFEYIQTTGIVAKAQGIAKALLGPIKIERDGLLSFKEIASRFPPSTYSEGCFAGPDFILMAHPCYRRGMHPVNNWAPRFIDLFWRFDEPGVEKYIALDEDRVRIDVDGLGYFEADTWYGAPFDQDIRNIKPGIAKLRPPWTLNLELPPTSLPTPTALTSSGVSRTASSRSRPWKSRQRTSVSRSVGSITSQPATCMPSSTLLPIVLDTSMARFSFSRTKNIYIGAIPTSI